MREFGGINGLSQFVWETTFCWKASVQATARLADTLPLVGGERGRIGAVEHEEVFLKAAVGPAAAGGGGVIRVGRCRIMLASVGRPASD